MSRYNFKPALIPTLAFILILPCLIALGFWQLDRAAQKKALIEGIASAQTQTPLTLQAYMKESADSQLYHSLAIQGRFLPGDDLLLMHVQVQGQTGYDVLSTFETEYEGRMLYILVNRGFVPEAVLKACTAQGSCPFWTLNPSQTRVIRGIITRPQATRFILGETVPEPKVRPLAIQRTELPAITLITGRTYLPVILLMQDSSQEGLVTHWALNLMPPEKHLGYAVQWFGLALCLIVIYVVVNLRRKDGSGNK